MTIQFSMHIRLEDFTNYRKTKIQFPNLDNSLHFDSNHIDLDVFFRIGFEIKIMIDY